MPRAVQPHAAASRILVVKLASLGDLLTITPALRAVRSTFPRSHVAVLATPSSAAALSGLDSIDEVIPFDKFAFDHPGGLLSGFPHAARFARDLRGGDWDALLLLHHLTTPYGVAKYAALALASGAPVRAGLDNGRGRFLTHPAADHGFGWQHEADYWLDVAAQIGAHHPASPRLELPISPQDQAWADAYWQEVRVNRVAFYGIGSGAFSRARRWHPDRFVQTARALHAQYGLEPLVLGGLDADEQALARRFLADFGVPARLVPPAPTPGALGALLRKGRVLVANDSGPVHLAAAVGLPVVSIFGPTNHRAWGPYPPHDERNQVAREDLACSPCIHRGHDFGTPQGCAARTCLAILQPDRVVQAAERALAATQSSALPFAIGADAGGQSHPATNSDEMTPVATLPCPPSPVAESQPERHAPVAVARSAELIAPETRSTT